VFDSALMIPAVTAIVVFLIYMIGMQFVGKQENVRSRVRKMVETSGNESTLNFAESLSAEREPSAAAKRIAVFLRMLGMDTEAARVNNQLRFYQAGIESPDAFVYYLLFKRVISVILVLTGIVISTGDDAGLPQYIITLILIFIGIFGADTYIKNCQEKRRKILENSFPDSLDLLLACVESGLALDGALARVCKELGNAHPEITQELNRTRMELSLLNDRTQALNNLAERNNLPAFRSLVTALLQSERFGTSLVDTLRVLSEDYRLQRLMRAEEKAARLPAMMTVPLILFLLPALIIIILGPAILTVIKTLFG